MFVVSKYGGPFGFFRVGVKITTRKSRRPSSVCGNKQLVLPPSPPTKLFLKSCKVGKSFKNSMFTLLFFSTIFLWKNPLQIKLVVVGPHYLLKKVKMIKDTIAISPKIMRLKNVHNLMKKNLILGYYPSNILMTYWLHHRNFTKQSYYFIRKFMSQFLGVTNN